jgi:hypothetical protein
MTRCIRRAIARVATASLAAVAGSSTALQVARGAPADVLLLDRPGASGVTPAARPIEGHEYAVSGQTGRPRTPRAHRPAATRACARALLTLSLLLGVIASGCPSESVDQETNTPSPDPCAELADHIAALQSADPEYAHVRAEVLAAFARRTATPMCARQMTTRDIECALRAVSLDELRACRGVTTGA